MTQVNSSTPLIYGMRDAFFSALYPIFLQDKKTVLISADNGAPTVDKISLLDGQFRNVGIAEEQMIGMACGLALEGRHVWVYAIDVFVTLRCLEFLKVDMCVMDLPIVALGVGAGYGYDIMGPTHHAVGVVAALRAWPNLKIYSPADSVTAAALARISYENNHPQCIRFDRTGLTDLYRNRAIDFHEGMVLAREGKEVCIISTGIMVHQALKVAAELERQKKLKVSVLDLYRLKPINTSLLLSFLSQFSYIITLEEDFLAGGLGSMIAEIIVDNRFKIPMLRIGQGEHFVFDLGGREAIWEKYGLDVSSIAQKILLWLR